MGNLRTRALVHALAERLTEVKTESFGDIHDDVMNEAPVYTPNERLAKVTDKTLGQAGLWKTRLTATECAMWQPKHWSTRFLTR